ncbi:elicitor-responsive protein 3-like [Lycium ferocissimum]|uniref:elicitor-responsive protein 3-like n=1 Tax=Lycium ferocissimum TaxID=112874 RepID=UPI002815F3AD|nr:elicitor-responsive protein 3-like [Lycium ferocissimum]
MPSGTLEVLLENAKGLEDQNWLTSMNPYVVITCRTQEKESSIASGEGSEPEWNETFIFTIGHDTEEITLKIMDNDTFSSDDFVGEATIPLHEVLREGEVPTRSYNVVKDEEYCGEIKLGLTFTAGSGSGRGSDDEEYGGRRKSRARGSDEEEEYGGRRHSRDHSRGSDEDNSGRPRKSRDHDYSGSDEDKYGGHRRSRVHDKGGDEEDNYGGYRESRDEDD